MTGILDITDLKVHFGAVRACDGISMSIAEGELVGLVGPNGSGKTTCLKAVCGAVPITGGRVQLKDRDVTGQPSNKIAHLGMVRTFQHPTLFPSATVRTSVRMGMSCSLSFWGRRRRGSAVPQDPDELLEFCGLNDVADVPCSSLSSGLLRRVGVALAIAVTPAVVLLDEPAAGLNDVESAGLAQLLAAVRDAGITLVVVDHDMRFLLSIVDRVVVLDEGRVLTTGTPAEILANPEVVRVYLGRRAAGQALPSVTSP